MDPNQKTRRSKLLTSLAVLAGIGGVATWKWDAIVAHPAATGAIDAIAANPVVSALIGAVAAFLTAVAAFLVKVRGKLEDKWAGSVADWVDAQVRLWGSLLLSGFRRRYYRQLRYRHRVFNVRGLRTRGTFTLELEKVFVELRVAPQSHPDLSPGLLRSEGLTGKRSVWDLLVSDQSAFRNLAIIGPRARRPEWMVVKWQQFIYLMNNGHRDTWFSDRRIRLASFEALRCAATARSARFGLPPSSRISTPPGVSPNRLRSLERRLGY